ncbi:pyruvate:ferredoxin (flavodoxin) oxidoreductase [Clostridium sp. LIBA-8841]|uniref:pyruvate:ferredoxin (flavodoxin) oxidoreductase n=1 Tax=Clostridium sp. LIBA-8841 TaxID=2987530 RepID=UPI002AC3EC8E|nr:pyruvate:ferredoxin (flavodoxin) oxidoreductase [Clostridium sp. LIBA-8841]MDZ5253012.1 pyruvate:ferredoxin (flavodoxin) oxidoreductase [Clostridium sp. LIBA-8841]
MRKMKTMDGNTAAAYISYAFTDVAAIFPITPSSPMAEWVDENSARGLKNIFGQTVKVMEMQSEAGAAGAVHGSLQAGALTTTYTASQGLLLMIPNMYKIAGELLPSVFHVSARALATSALNIFGDHQDVMAARQTGFAMLAEGSVQEVMDLSAVAHLASIKSRIPFVNFFDGFRTSHEIQKVELLQYDELKELVDMEAVEEFRRRALNPNKPVTRGTAQNPDIYFQEREAVNKFYDVVPEIVESYMKEITKLTGREYNCFDYYGAEDAERVIVAMGSVTDLVEETVDYLNAKGEKVGLVKVRLFRPFSNERLIKAMPKTVKRVAVLDRTKEPGAAGEPLYLEVKNAFYGLENAPEIVGGRFGLGSKDTIPAHIIAVYENLSKEEPKNGFTLAIVDDVTNTSLEESAEAHEVDTTPEGTKACKFWGLGSDGTVGANKSAIKIIGDHTDMYAQGYFAYDSKKSGGVTISHLRFGKQPIKSPYLINKADFVACHNQSYVQKYFVLDGLKKNGTFLLNTIWTPEEVAEHLPASYKRFLAENNIKFYTLNAVKIAQEVGLGGRINMIMQSAFFKLANIIPVEDAVKYLKDAVVTSYGKKGEKVVNMNHAAIDKGIDAIVEISVPAEWANAKDEVVETKEVPAFIKNIVEPMNRLEGDKLPVSAFNGMEDGTFQQGTAAYEKRGIGINIPEWIADNCIQCNQCAYVCPHATIRPFLLTEEEVKNAPASTKLIPAKGLKTEEPMEFTMAVSPLDCTGCGNCAQVCPAKEKALVMKPQHTQADQQEAWDYCVEEVAPKKNPMNKNTVKGSQFEQPLFEFSGACAGCGETSYVKLITQLFGDRMMIANATGCSSIWGGSAPSTPYTTNHNGHGPAWANSLFEDNAEFGLGMFLGVKAIRERLVDLAGKAIEAGVKPEAKEALEAWIAEVDNGEGTRDRADAVIASLQGETNEFAKEILKDQDYLAKRSQWIFGGDGWAYDIGYGGVDHVLASGEDVNILVMDTEIYSNTGGQASKSTPTAAIAKFAAAGKRTKKKDLGMMAMSYGYVYVAQISMGADKNQTLKAIAEAEAYKGPSLIIAYAPCISHGLKAGMGNSQLEEKRAVECGYWAMYRFNPMLKETGKNPFSLDSKEPTGDFREFIMGEVRYAALAKAFPEAAEALFEKTERDAKERLEGYKKLAGK